MVNIGGEGWSRLVQRRGVPDFPASRVPRYKVASVWTKRQACDAAPQRSRQRENLAAGFRVPKLDEGSAVRAHHGQAPAIGAERNGVSGGQVSYTPQGAYLRAGPRIPKP